MLSTGSHSTRKAEVLVLSGPGGANLPPGRRAGSSVFSRLPSRLVLLGSTIVLQLGLAVVYFAWATRPQPNATEIALQTEPASPNVDNTSVSGAVDTDNQPDPTPWSAPQPTLEEPVAAPTPVEAGPQPSRREETPESLPPPAIETLPPLPLPPGIEAVAPPLHADPLGDITMTHLQSLGFPVLLAAALTAAPLVGEETRPADGAKPAAVDTSNLEKLLRKQGRAQKKAIQELGSEIKGLRKTVEDTQTETRLLKQAQSVTSQEVKDARADLERLRERVGALESQLNSQLSRTESLSNELNRLNGGVMPRESRFQAPDTRGRPGTIQIRNSWMRQVAVRVNDRVHYVDPNSTKVLDGQPAGTFTYEVLGHEPARTRSLNPGDQFTINVFTLQ